MTFSQANRQAARRAKQSGNWRYVVRDGEDYDSYEVATDAELDTFFLGAPVLASYGRDGELED